MYLRKICFPERGRATSRSIGFRLSWNIGESQKYSRKKMCKPNSVNAVKVPLPEDSLDYTEIVFVGIPNENQEQHMWASIH
jgi:hypothetical protein